MVGVTATVNPNKRTGHDDAGRYYIRTYTGKPFYWDRVEDNEYDIVDIAHSLAMSCRWTGHTKHFYSVAQHSFYAAMVAPQEFKMAALLHDATEYVMHDTPSPLKWFLQEKGFTAFADLEKRIDQSLFKAFALQWPRDPLIKQIDLRLLATESRDLMSHHYDHTGELDPYQWRIIEMTPAHAEKLFLDTYYELIDINNP